MTSDEEDDDINNIRDKKWKFNEPHYKCKNMLLPTKNIEELKDGLELNQDLMDFALFYEFSKWSKEFKELCYLLSSQFWRYLSAQNADRLKNAQKCYKKIGNDIMKKKYIIFPINSANHWQLVIIVNANMINNNSKYNKSCIIILDSTKKGPAFYYSDCQKIREWLNFEMKAKLYNATTCKHLTPDVPQQNDGYDCGLFVWQNMIQFGKEQGFQDTSSENKV